MGIATTNTRTPDLTADINDAVEQLLSTNDSGPSIPRILFTTRADAAALVEAVVLWPGASPLLADVTTQFEHFGLRVADREPLAVPTADGTVSRPLSDIPTTLHRFTFAAADVVDPQSLALVSDAFEAHSLHGFEIDDFARLILTAGLTWREVSLVRAATRFVRQAGSGLSESYVIDTLRRHHAFARVLVDYFAARFDPASFAESDLEVAARRIVHAHIDKARTDPVNDSVRVDASELRCRVVGEGGNLGFTQRARIEYALGGGIINADFIDNAAGVASSDLEVNLKIALDVAVQAGDIDVSGRNELLSSAEQDVAEAVLRNSESQSLAIDLASAQAPRLLARHQRLIGNLEDRNGISRAGEVLPDGKELSLRAKAGLGLTRPEIAVLLAQSKNVVRDELLASSVPEEPAFAGALPAYFPERLRAALGDRIRTHRLAREIIATAIADDLINHVGPGLIYQLEERLGVKTPEVARAYAVVRGVFDVDAMWRHARDRDDLGAADQRDLLSRLQHFIERTASWLLRRRPTPIDIQSEIARFRPAALDAVADPRTAAERIADGSSNLADILDHTETARQHGVSPATAAAVHAQTGRDLGLDWLAHRLEEHIPVGWWDGMAISTVRDELADNHHSLVGAIVSSRSPEEDGTAAWLSRQGEQVDRLTRMIVELRRDGTIDVARACTVNAELALLVRATRS